MSLSAVAKEEHLQAIPELKDLAATIVELATDKKAVDPKLLDMRGLVDYTDCFALLSGGSDRQLKAIHDSIYTGLKQRFGMLPDHDEGTPEAGWLLLDYNDVIVHIFSPDKREYYRLDRLWGEAPAL